MTAQLIGAWVTHGFRVAASTVRNENAQVLRVLEPEMLLLGAAPYVVFHLVHGQHRHLRGPISSAIRDSDDQRAHSAGRVGRAPPLSGRATSHAPVHGSVRVAADTGADGVRRVRVRVGLAPIMPLRPWRGTRTISGKHPRRAAGHW